MCALTRYKCINLIYGTLLVTYDVNMVVFLGLFHCPAHLTFATSKSSFVITKNCYQSFGGSGTLCASLSLRLGALQ